MFTCSGLEGNPCWANELRPLNPFVSTWFPDSSVAGDGPFPRCWQPLNNKRGVRGRPPNPQGSEALLLRPNQLRFMLGWIYRVVSGWMDLGKTLTRAVCLLSTQLLPMDGATAAGGSREPAANGSKPEEQLDPSRSKELPSQLAASFHFSRLFCISSSNCSLVPTFFCRK